MSETIQIEVTLDGGFLHDGVKYSKGDVSTEDYNLGMYFIRAGWAKDTSGVVPSVSPSTTETVLLVQDVVSQPKVTTGE